MVCQFIDGLILVRFETKIYIISAHSHEVIAKLKIKCLHATFVESETIHKFDCTRESQTLMKTGFDIVTLQQANEKNFNL